MLQDGRRRPNHGAMPLLNKTIYYTYYIHVEPLNESLIENYVYNFFKKWANRGLLFVYFRLFHTTQFKYGLIKALMVYSGLENVTAGWIVHTNTLSYGDIHFYSLML